MHDENRKSFPVATGLIDYFPDALLAVSSVSMEGARKHGTFNDEGYPTWDRSKSADDADALGRHLLHRGKFDTDGHRHSAKVAWRALAVLQKELDAAAEYAAIDGDDYMHKGDGANAVINGERPFKGMGDTENVTLKTSLDPAKPSSNKTMFAVYGDTNLSIETLAAAAGVRVEQMIDMRAKLRPEVEPFAPWYVKTRRTVVQDFVKFLNLRKGCVHVGTAHGLTGPVEIAAAMAEYFGDMPIDAG